MCCEDLVCARCTGPVSEARCPSCRSARDSMHHTLFTVTPQMLVVVMSVLLILTFLAAQHG